MEVISYLAIEPGEEIVMSCELPLQPHAHGYADCEITDVPLSMAREPRRAYLRQNWDFDCGCALCRASEFDISESEGRRKQMDSLQETLADARSNGYYKDAIAIAGDYLDFCGWEELPPLMPEHHATLADLYVLANDAINATRYARMAMDGWVRLGSVDDEPLEKARTVLEGLTRTP